MMIRERAADLDRLLEMKVKIPVRFHMKLRAMKLLHGKNMSDAVTEALESYFERASERGEAPILPPPLVAMGPGLRSDR